MTRRSTPVLRNYVDGRFIDAGRQFEKRSPVDGSLLSSVVEADAALVDEAVVAARRALAGDWGRMKEAERLALLEKVAAGIEHRFEEFANAETADTGKPLGLSRTLDVPRSAANFRAFASLVRNVPAESFRTDTDDGRGALNYAVRHPLGVLAVIVPWNLPLLLLTWKVAPALAAGNTVVAKPSEVTPATAVLLAEVMHEAGVPQGVFNVVNGFGAQSTGEHLTSHPGIDGVTFTGETTTGAAIMRTVAANVKPVSFELGGKNAAIVFADADFDATVTGVARAVFANSGQVCLCAERVYVQRPMFERFAAALAARTSALRIGSPYEAATDMGPLVSHEHRDKVLSYYRLARSEGATLLAGGDAPALEPALAQGAFVQPTVMTGLPESARCVREEIFGPICHVAPFDTEEDAIRLANDSRYGLAASIWTRDLGTAHRVAQRLAVGIVWVNTWYLRDLRTPFGGMKLSGIGREGGVHSLDFYSSLTNVCIKL